MLTRTGLLTKTFLPDGYVPEDVALRRLLAAVNYYEDIPEGVLMADWC